MSDMIQNASILLLAVAIIITNLTMGGRRR